MKNKKIIYIISIASCLLAGLFIYQYKFKPPEKFDSIVRFRRTSYRPYDTKFFYDEVRKAAGNKFAINDSILNRTSQYYTKNDAVFMFCGPYFHPDFSEIEYLSEYIDRGNTIFISSLYINQEFLRKIFNQEDWAFWTTSEMQEGDSITLNISDHSRYSYPGKNYRIDLFKIMQLQSEGSILVRDQNDNPVLVELKSGDNGGRVIFLASPLTITNYFLLHKENVGFLTYVSNLLELTERQVVWDSYYDYLTGTNRFDSKPPEAGRSFFIEFMNDHPPLKWAVITCLIGACLFLWNYSRRTTRTVSFVPDIENETVNFSRALSELYWQKKSDTSIALKLQLLLYDRLSTSYKINPAEFTAERAEQIAFKTGFPIHDLAKLIEMNQFLSTVKKINNNYLNTYYILIHKFIYK